MANSPTFVAHALDLLSLLGPVQARSMFGGHGLYLRGVMFGLLDDDELFVKTDGVSRPAFLAASCRTWVFPGMDETSYYRPPDEAHEDAEAMLRWATLGLESALRLKAVKDAAERAKAARRAEREARTAVTLRAPRGPGRAGARKRPAPGKKAAPAMKAPPGKKAAPARKPTAPRKRG
jgi:DNA transformation protein